MCAGFTNGVKAIIPVADLEEARVYKDKGYFVAAERGGQIPEGFHLGNSPIEWQQEALKDQSVVLTTTNGTHAIEQAGTAGQILIGAFLNAGALTSYLGTLQKDVLLLCAGWKNRFSLEDTVCAGMLLANLESSHHEVQNDEAYTARELYRHHHQDLHHFLAQGAHAKRLTGLKHQKDFDFCMQRDLYEVVPVLEGQQIVPLNHY